MNNLPATQQNLLSKMCDDVVFMFVKPRSPNWGYVREMLQSGKIYWFDDDKKEYCAGFSFSKDSILIIRIIWRYVKFWKTCTVFVRGVAYNDTQSYENWLDCYLESFDFENKEEYCYEERLIGIDKGKEIIFEAPCKCPFAWGEFLLYCKNTNDIPKRFYECCLNKKLNLCPLLDLEKVKNARVIISPKKDVEENHVWTVQEAKELCELLGMDMPLKELSFLKTSDKQNKSFGKIWLWIIGALLLLIIFS